jgi:3-oxoacyl-[acyl-carrier protein] reductase
MLKGRVAVITGAASIKGIGFGIAKKFAENGSHIILNDIREPDEETLSELKKIENSGTKTLFIAGDITDSKQVAKLVKNTIDTFGKVDILVNNAAYAPAPKSILDTPEEEWDRVLAVNLKGPFLLCKEVGLHMKQAKYGKIINIAAVSGLAPVIPEVHYNSSKAALIMLTQDVALDFAPFNVTVNCICPGIIVTALTESVVPKGMDKKIFFQNMTKLNIPMQREGYPEDIANAALFLASDLASYITGQVLIVGGGAPLSRVKIPE